MNGLGVAVVGGGLAVWLGAMLWLDADDAAPRRLPVPALITASEPAEAAVPRRELVVAPCAPPEPIANADTANAARLQDLLRQIDAGDAGPESVRALREVLVAAPALAATVPELLARGGLGEHAEARLLQALELGATGSCQQALIAIAADLRGSTARRLQCLRALGNVAQPSPATMQLLWSTVATGEATAARVALLAAGRAAAALRTSDAGAYRLASSELQRTLQLAAAPDAAVAALQAIAHTGDASFASAVTARLGDTEPSVRTAAARALATIAGADAAPALIAAFAVEADAAVRRSIARLLALSGVDARGAAALLPLLRCERDERVRACIATCLARS